KLTPTGLRNRRATDQTMWPFARQSISDWKQEYMPECGGCIVKDRCGGFFSSAHLRYSSHIEPVLGQLASQLK
ncbi:hypothetical protein ABTQ05_21385, partial [Acinetobacter baumannii]